MGDIVFTQRHKMRELSDLTWEFMQQQLDSILLQGDKTSEEYFDKRDSASIDYTKIDFDYIFENDYKSQTMKKMLR